MKTLKMRELCFENNLSENDLLIQFIMKITPKREVSYQIYEYDITEDKFKIWIENFKSGNPVTYMTKDEVRIFIALLMRYV